MEIFLTFLRVFAVGGSLCLLGQILINTTKITSARILVLFLLVGVVLEFCGVYKYIVEFGGSGATLPITGFGSSLAKGAREGAQNDGILGAVRGGLEAVSVGVASVVVFAFLTALIFNAKTKKY